MLHAPTPTKIPAALLLAFALPLGSACTSRDPIAPPDPTRDATTADARPGEDGDGGVTRADAAPDASAPAPDSGPRDIGAFDADVTDMTLPAPLAAVALTWTTPLELCNAWREGADFADELAAELHVTVRPGPRTGLDVAALSGATLGPTMVRRSARGDGQWFVAEPARPQLVEWRVRDQGGTPYLDARLVHDLGDGGLLVESLTLSGRAGRPGTIDWTDSNELAFAYAAPGTALDAARPLVRCTGNAALEDAVEVIAARGAMRDATVVRRLRTRPAVAGSSPVHIQGALVTLSDETNPYLLSGPLATTYAAEHHNWVEHSRYDFTRDPVVHSLYIAPEAGDETAPPGWIVERVDVIDVVAGPQRPAQLELVRLDTRDGNRTTERMPIGDQAWRRVDDTELLRAAAGECAMPEVTSIGRAHDHWLQLVSCPGAGAIGRRVVMVVPVVFRHDVTVVGQRFSGAALSERGTTLHVEIGASTVDITAAGEDVYDFVVRDAMGAVRSEYPTYLGPLRMPEPRDESHAYTGPDGLEVTLERRWGEQGSGRSAVYAPLALEVVYQGRRYRVEALDRLRYTSTHHNWHDVLEADAGELRFRWSVRRIDPPEGTFLRVTRSDGTLLLPDTRLTEP